MLKPAQSPPWCFPRKGRHPFKIYFRHGKLRIIFTNGIAHNAEWLHLLNPDDQVISTLPWHYTAERFRNEKQFLLDHGHDISNWWILCNTADQVRDCRAAGFQAHHVNNNCWLDEHSIPLSGNQEKRFRAIYTARCEPYKRHDLCMKVRKLALIAWGGREGFYIDDITCEWKSSDFLTREQVYAKIGESTCGLALSAVEGAMYASSEYLLCGVPVVSTPSEGGRDVFYNEENSLICEPNPQSVAEAVDLVNARAREGYYDRSAIRERHIVLAKAFRKNFIVILNEIFDRQQVKVHAETYFFDNFKHKMLCNFVKTDSIREHLSRY